MRRATLGVVYKTLLAAIIVLGVPLLLLAPSAVWYSAQNVLQKQAQSIAKNMDQVDGHYQIRAKYEFEILHAKGVKEVWLRVSPPRQIPTEFGVKPGRVSLVAEAISEDGVHVALGESGEDTVKTAGAAVATIVGAMLVLVVIATYQAFQYSRELSAPLVYLAAQAERIGATSSHTQLDPTGFEEMDLVSEEISRAGSRIASQVAQQRQFASDVTHQLRTPLASLSMRIEEIDYLSENLDVKAECKACLDQVERMIGVMDALKKRNQRTAVASTEAIDIEDIFRQQSEEWNWQFEQVERAIQFHHSVHDRVAMGTPGSLSQALATIIENSLKYGAGRVTVSTRDGASKQVLFIDISDEGAGIDDEIAPDIFIRGISGQGSSGIGLALARDLIEADGGRLELTQRRPPIFTISLSAVPQRFVPERVLPKGAMISVSRHGSSIF